MTRAWTTADCRCSGGSPRYVRGGVTPDELALTAVTMAALPPHVNLLEAIVLPVTQAYLGRG